MSIDCIQTQFFCRDNLSAGQLMCFLSLIYNNVFNYDLELLMLELNIYAMQEYLLPPDREGGLSSRRQIWYRVDLGGAITLSTLGYH